MSIAKLSLVSIVGELGRLDDVVLRCLDRGDFHPESPNQTTSGIHGFVSLSEENPYTELLAKITDVGVQAGLSPNLLPAKIKAGILKTPAELNRQDCSTFAETFGQELNELRQRRNFLKAEIDQDEGALVYLSHLESLNVDFDDIFSCKYTKVRFGRLPIDNQSKLAFYQDKPFIFAPFDQGKQYCWGAYFALNEDMPEIDAIFASLYFERMRVPDFVHGTAEAALSHLRETLAQNRKELAEVEQKRLALIAQRRDTFYRLHVRLKYLSDSFEMRRYVSVFKRQFVDVFYITGFVEEDQVQDFAKDLQQLEGVSVEIRPYDSDKRIKPPTKLKNGWFSKPFELFVEMYGLPAYGDFDPTPFVAFTYCLLFGIMFGDLGQGILLILGGELLWRLKKMNLGRVISRIGGFSCIFGLLYGSVFGFEELLEPLYHALGLSGKPIEVMAPENTNVILIGAVALGVLLICTSILIDICIALRRRDMERALFSSNGVAGFVFYASVIFGAVMLFVTGTNYFNVFYVVGLVAVPLAIILFKEPLALLMQGKSGRPHDGYGAYITEGAFELFEVLLSFFSNTMSFLRVGGFVLSHAGMMAVVFTLSEMVGATASPFVIIIGNLFVIAMEGLIVGIQVLRLEFYEMFSRYFDGTGRPFVPFTVEQDR